MIKTIAGALNAIRRAKTHDELRLVWADLSRCAWNDRGALRQAYEKRQDELFQELFK